MSVVPTRTSPSSGHPAPPSAELERLLAAALAAVGAADGAIWGADLTGELHPLHQAGLGQQSIATRHANWPGHADLLKGILATGTTRVVQARFEPDRAGDSIRELRIVLQPLALSAPGVGGPPVGILELFLPAGRGSLSDEQVLRVLEGLGRAFRGTPTPAAAASSAAPALEQVLEFCLRAHQSLDLQETAYTLVAEAQRILGADRVTLLRRQANGARLLAVSGVDRADPRSTMVRQLERLAAAALALGGPLRYPAGESLLPPAVRTELEDYAAKSSLQRLEVVPLERGPGTIGFLIVEDFTPRQSPGGWPLLAGVNAVATSALSHALEQAELPLFGLSDRLRRSGLTRTWLRTAVRLALLGGLVAGGIALATVPARLEVVGRGTLVPERRRDVFAPLAGVVETIPVKHGQDVARGDRIVTLRSPTLDYEIARVQGEHQTTEQQIADITSLRTDPSRPRANSASDAELAAREEELKAVRDNLVKQRALLEEQRTSQVVLAPIAGRVLTWDVGQLLEERPVERGQRLLTIGEVAGPWIVELRVPDRDAGHLRAAERGRKPGEKLAALFSVTTDLDHRVPAEILSIADIVEDDPLEGPSVLVKLAFPRDAVRDLLPGATAVGRIDCGERVVGYVWFRRLIDAVKTWWEF